MNRKTKATKPPSEKFQNFENLAKRLISVPKSEIDKREAEYQRAKKTHKKKRVAYVVHPGNETES
jgi:hypothetical protein